MPVLYLTNPAHARIAGWLNAWPDYVAPNLYPLELALLMAGRHTQSPLTGPAWWAWWWRQKGD